MKKYLLIASVLLAIIGIGVLSYDSPLAAQASVVDSTFIGTATTSTAIAVTSSTRILATTTSITGPSYIRAYATICNPSANPVYIFLGNDVAASVTKATAIIAAAAGYNVCYEITGRNLYQGSVTASSTGQTSTSVIVTDYVQ